MLCWPWNLNWSCRGERYRSQTMAQRVIEVYGCHVELYSRQDAPESYIYCICPARSPQADGLQLHSIQQNCTANLMFLTLPTSYLSSSRTSVDGCTVLVHTHTWRTEQAIMNHCIYCFYWYHSMCSYFQHSICVYVIVENLVDML